MVGAVHFGVLDSIWILTPNIISWLIPPVADHADGAVRHMPAPLYGLIVLHRLAVGPQRFGPMHRMQQLLVRLGAAFSELSLALVSAIRFQISYTPNGWAPTST